jgi:DNA-binding CsgD family transcriptional regulator
VDIAGRMREFGRTAPLYSVAADRIAGLADRDADLLASAAERLAATGFPLLAAQVRLEWAELTGARDAVVSCLPVFEAAGATPWVDRCRSVARSLGVRIPTGRAGGVLSKRETEVVRLVADGLSNADIARRLFLSERTIETHLRNSYAKLGLSSRVALARWVAGQDS